MGSDGLPGPRWGTRIPETGLAVAGGSTQAFEWHGIGQAGHRLFVFPVEEEGRCRRTGHDGVHGHVASGQLLGQDERDGLDCSLAGRVSDLVVHLVRREESERLIPTLHELVTSLLGSSENNA
jgi:hypothetical protein